MTKEIEPALPDMEDFTKFMIPVPEDFGFQRRVPVMPEGSFPAPSLSAWLLLAKKADIKFVPADEVGVFNIMDLMHYDTPDKHPETVPELARLDALNKKLPPGHMLRWDCCAPVGVKYVMSKGLPAADQKAGRRPGACPLREDLCLMAGDPRAFDILYEYPAERLPVLQRPWIQALMVGQYPVEFRVFVEEGKVIAISNYYVQRPLPLTRKTVLWATLCSEYSKRIIAASVETGYWPAMPPREYDLTRPVADRISCTLDFLVREDGEVLFLEAGPGVGLAHPCCFYNDATSTMATISGLLLAVGGEALPLESLSLKMLTLPA